MYMNDGNKTKINLRNKSVFITGVAGFIGSNLAKRLLSTVEGVKVVGLDNMNHYYDVRLKEARLNELEQFDNFSFVKGNLADKAVIPRWNIWFMRRVLPYMVAIKKCLTVRMTRWITRYRCMQRPRSPMN